MIPFHPVTQYPSLTSQCDALITAGLGNRVVLPSHASYEPRIQSYWALNTRRHPYCLVQPHTAQEVSTVLTTLLGRNENGNASTQIDGAGDWHVAIRAGGHNLGDSNNIANGVTIDLAYLNGTSYNARTNIASIGPGAKWEDVYASLHEYGVVATGGRDGDVGVGGFLLGGGSTYYMAKEGFGCDSIANFEVVLANGTIVHANQNENEDLWRALKGGGSNFGVVTRYDMKALPDKKLVRGQRSISAKYTGQFVDAVVDFTDKQEKFDDDALIAILAHVEGEDILATIEVNTEGVQNSTGFDKFTKIPQIKPFEQNVGYLYEAARNSTLPGDAWYVALSYGQSYILISQGPANNPNIQERRKDAQLRRISTRKIRRCRAKGHRKAKLLQHYLLPAPALFLRRYQREARRQHVRGYLERRKRRALDRRAIREHQPV